MSLPPNFFISIEKLKSFDCSINKFKIIYYCYFFPIFNLFRLKDFIRIPKGRKIKSNRISTTFFIWVWHRFKNWSPSFSSLVEFICSFLICDRIYYILGIKITFIEKFSTSMSKKFMEYNFVKHSSWEML